MSVRPWRWLAGVVGGGVIALALALGLLRLALNRAPEHAREIADWIYAQTELRLQFARLDARLRWFGPEIVLHDARVLDRDGREALFATREGTIGLDLLALFRSGEIVAGRIEFLEPALSVERLEDGRFRLVGLHRRADRPPFDLDRLPGGRLVIRNATVAYRDLATGRGPWRLDGLDLELRRGDAKLDATGTARLPQSVGRTLKFELRLDGQLSDLRRLDGRLEATVQDVSVPGLAELLPGFVLRPLGGRGSLHAVVGLEQGRVARGRLDLDLDELRFGLPQREPQPIEAVEISAPHAAPGGNSLSLPVVDKHFVQRPGRPLPRELRYAAVRGTLKYRDDGAQRTLIAQGLELDTGAARARIGPQPIDAELSLRGKLRTRFEISADVSRLDLAALWPLVQALPIAALEPWLGLDPRGEIVSLELQMRRDRAGAEPAFEGRLEVTGLATRAVGRFAGLAGLSLTAAGSDRAGTLALAAQSASLEWPRLFRVPIELRRAQADLRWTRQGRAWVFAGENARVEHEDVDATGRFALTLEQGAPSPLLELHATVTRADAAVVRKVLPIGRLRPGTIAWFERADIQGSAKHGVLEYSGPVRKFPFRNGEGRFAASADISDAALNYFDGFTPLRAAAAQIEFANAGMRVRSESARIGALAIERGEYFMADYAKPVIEVQGTARGDFAQALEYLQRSPLGPRLGHEFMALRGSGVARYAFELRLPTADPRRRHYSVAVDLQSASLELPVMRAPLLGLSGKVLIEDLSARGEGLRGRYLDGPVELSLGPVQPEAGADVAIALKARGRAAGTRLAPLLSMPEGVSASGELDYQLDGRIERLGERGPWRSNFRLASDLVGLGIRAPAPFAKSPSESRRSVVRVSLPNATHTELRVESASARAMLAFAPRKGRWQLERGQARFDAGAVQLPARPGLQVLGEWPDVDLAEWFALGGTATGDGRQRLWEWLGSMDVKVDRLQLLGFSFADVDAHMESGARSWRVDLLGPQVEGRVVVPFEIDGRDPIVADLSRLVLLPAPARGATGAETDPRRAPSVLLRADDFQWQGRRFGRFEADLLREAEGLRLTRLASSGDAFTLEGEGSWLAIAGGSQSRLGLRLRSSDLAASARALGYRGSVEAKRAFIDATAAWPGGLSQDVLGRMAGSIHLELDDGQLREVEPGAGRVLGLLSFVQLPRRLALDFRDVTGEGLAFDTVRGDFALREGSAYTQNLLLKGAAVDIGIVGRTGLVAEDYDQTLVVSGNPGGPLAVAGALAGGPVIGAGVLVLSQLFKGQLQGLTRAYYRVSGSWAEPVVERVAAPATSSLAAGGEAAAGAS